MADKPDVPVLLRVRRLVFGWGFMGRWVWRWSDQKIARLAEEVSSTGVSPDEGG